MADGAESLDYQAVTFLPDTALDESATPTSVIWGTWGNAETVLQETFGKTGNIAAEATLNYENGWKHSWAILPYQATGDDGTTYTVQYRVVETKVGDVEVAVPTDSDLILTYPLAASYNGNGKTALSTSQDATNHSQSSTSATTITNALDATEIRVTKQWQDDDNKWGLRPTSDDGKNWEVTYYLQRAVDADDHNDLAWEFIPDGENGLASRTVSGSYADETDGKTVTFENLPAKNADGKDYVYRVVGKVPGGYSVNGGSEVKDAAGHIYSAVDATWPSDDGAVSSQTFVNAINYTSFSGEKHWNDHGTGSAPADPATDPKPTIELQRTTTPDVKDSWGVVDAKLASPTWGKADGDGNVWTWRYDNFPQADAAGSLYTYRVVEPASIPGFSIAQGVSTGTPNAPGGQAGDKPLENVATRFAFDKVNDATDPQKVNNVELVVMRDSKVYAVWHRDADGAESGYLWRGGLPADQAWPGTTAGQSFVNVQDTGPTPMASQGGRVLVAGLPAGEYEVIESGPMTSTPDGTTDQHVRMEPFSISVAENGGIAPRDGTGATASTDADGTVLLTAVDPIFRAHFEFTKRLDDLQGTSLAGVTFDLQRVEEGGGRTTIFTGITTDANGRFSSKEAGAAYEGANVDKAHAALSDGLCRATTCSWRRAPPRAPSSPRMRSLSSRSPPTTTVRPSRSRARARPRASSRTRPSRPR